MDIDQVTYLTNSGHCLSAASATNDQHIVFQRDDSFTLLSVKRIRQYRVEVSAIAGQLILDKMIIISPLVSGRV